MPNIKHKDVKMENLKSILNSASEFENKQKNK